MMTTTTTTTTNTNTTTTLDYSLDAVVVGLVEAKRLAVEAVFRAAAHLRVMRFAKGVTNGITEADELRAHAIVEEKKAMLIDASLALELVDYAKEVAADVAV